MRSLALNAAGAWLARQRAAVAELDAMAKAPALFTPERVEQVRVEFGTADHWCRYWLGVGA